MRMRGEQVVMICAGATKAGTSWLYEHLFRHPDCHFRTIKELHYFDTVESGRFGLRLRAHRDELAAVEARLPGLTGDRHAHALRRINDLRDWIAVLSSKTEDRAAYAAYMAEGANGRVVGDVTPAYATLAADTLRRIADLGANLRFVYLMRDPVARLWSHVRMLARRETPEGGDFTAVTRARMAGVLAGEDPGLVARGDYRGTVEKLTSVMAPSRLMAIFTEDMMTRPGLSRLCEFLGIRVTEAPFARRVHEGAPLEMTAQERAGARRLLRDQYEYAATRFPALPDAWRKTMSEGFA